MHTFYVITPHYPNYRRVSDLRASTAQVEYFSRETGQQIEFSTVECPKHRLIELLVEWAENGATLTFRQPQPIVPPTLDACYE